MRWVIVLLVALNIGVGVFLWRSGAYGALFERQIAPAPALPRSWRRAETLQLTDEVPATALLPPAPPPPEPQPECLQLGPFLSEAAAADLAVRLAASGAEVALGRTAGVDDAARAVRIEDFPTAAAAAAAAASLAAQGLAATPIDAGPGAPALSLGPFSDAAAAAAALVQARELGFEARSVAVAAWWLVVGPGGGISADLEGLSPEDRAVVAAGVQDSCLSIAQGLVMQ